MFSCSSDLTLLVVTVQPTISPSVPPFPPPPPTLLQAFDRKVQLLREVAAKLTLAVQACSLHRHIADMSTVIQELASTDADSGTVDVGPSVVHLAQALQDSAAAESQCSVLLQDMLFQIDNVLRFDVARAVAFIISLEEAREALLFAMSKTRVRGTRSGSDEGRRRLQAEEYVCMQLATCESQHAILRTALEYFACCRLNSITGASLLGKFNSTDCLIH
jgi:hypothetical protein